MENTAAKTKLPFAVPEVAARGESMRRAMRALLEANMRDDDLRYVLDMCVWRYTEFDKNRYKFAIRYRTASVLAPGPAVEIQHEHVVERRWLLDRITEAPDKLEDILELAVACVVSRSEHDALRSADGFGWERYLACGIEVMDTASMAPADLAALAAAQRARARELDLAVPGARAAPRPPAARRASSVDDKATALVAGPPERPASGAGQAARREHVQRLCASSAEGLAKHGFGPLLAPRADRALLRAKAPAGLWWLAFQQIPYVHAKVTDHSVSLRMHVWAFPGDRARNNIALDLLRAAIERELKDALGPEVALNWRAARGGANQVLEMTAGGGVTAGAPEADADRFVAMAGSWAEVMGRHPMPDLRERVRAALGDPDAAMPAPER